MLTLVIIIIIYDDDILAAVVLVIAAAILHDELMMAISPFWQSSHFSVVGPTTWNGLPIDIRHLPNGARSQFQHLLKTVLFRLAWVGSASEYGSGRSAI